MKDIAFQEASRYGNVVALYQAAKPLHVGRVGVNMKKLNLREARAFLNHKYCQVMACSIPHCYRVWDTNQFRAWVPQKKSSFMLGRGLALGNGFPDRNPLEKDINKGIWLSTMRPTFMLDYREYTAMLHKWNRADFVLDASISPGANIYVGRAGPQSEDFGSNHRLYRGGAIQIYLPENQFGYLRLNKWWVVR